MPTSSPGHPPHRNKVPHREGVQGEAGDMSRSLCETCAWMREVVTPKGSRFLLCQLSQTDPAYPKYPPQPVVRCDGYQKEERVSVNHLLRRKWHDLLRAWAVDPSLADRTFEDVREHYARPGRFSHTLSHV